MRLFHKLEKQPKYYDSIMVLPLSRWNKINDTYDFGHLYHEYKKDNKLESIWAKIYNEYIEHFGLSDEFKDHLRKIKSLSILKYEQVEEFDSFRDAEITILENELKEQKEANNGLIMAMVSKFMGLPINPEKITVYEFYNYLSLCQTQLRVKN